jgi:hypothetical protein
VAANVEFGGVKEVAVFRCEVKGCGVDNLSALVAFRENDLGRSDCNDVKRFDFLLVFSSGVSLSGVRPICEEEDQCCIESDMEMKFENRRFLSKS